LDKCKYNYKLLIFVVWKYNTFCFFMMFVWGKEKCMQGYGGETWRVLTALKA
jgi:hypothetical protein